MIELVDSPLLHVLNSRSIQGTLQSFGAEPWLTAVTVPEGEKPSLDLYADIVSMPKNTEVAHDPMTDEGRKNAKEEGKRRTRELLAAAQGSKTTPTPETVEKRETKRAKSEA